MFCKKSLILFLLVFFIGNTFAENVGWPPCPINSSEAGDGLCYCNAPYVGLYSICITCDKYCELLQPDSGGVSGTYNNGTCDCECGVGYAAVEGVCTSCTQICNSMIPNSINASQEPNKCECICAVGYYASGSVCMPCSSFCTALDPNSMNNATQPNMCNCVCISGYEEIDGECVPVGECTSFCQSALAHSYGIMEGEDCVCYCNEGYVYIEEEGCVTDEEYEEKICDAGCRNQDPYTHGAVEGDDCMCYCIGGYVFYEDACISETEYEDIICNNSCSADYGNAYGIVEGEDCSCYCEQGYEIIGGRCQAIGQGCEGFCDDIPNSYLVETEEECSCYCNFGYEPVNGSCVKKREPSAQEINAVVEQISGATDAPENVEKGEEKTEEQKKEAIEKIANAEGLEKMDSEAKSKEKKESDKEKSGKAVAGADSVTKETISDLLVRLDALRSEASELSKKLDELGSGDKQAELLENAWKESSEEFREKTLEDIHALLKSLEESGDMRLEGNEHLKDYYSKIEAGMDETQALLEVFGLLLYGGTIKTGEDVSEVVLNDCYNALLEQLMDEDLYKSRSRYNDAVSIFGKINSAIKINNQVNGLVDAKLMSKDRARILKGGTWLGKFISFVASKLPVFGSAADKITEKTFDTSMKAFQGVAVATTYEEICYKDAMSKECEEAEERYWAWVYAQDGAKK
ncbi:MAG: hypothetical protein JW772_04000 [Candidatus Diapherotrites archaeon]|nr:hypothetical protein [Candidatus Diapherotrites archaeon]